MRDRLFRRPHREPRPGAPPVRAAEARGGPSAGGPLDRPPSAKPPARSRQYSASQPSALPVAACGGPIRCGPHPLRRRLPPRTAQVSVTGKGIDAVTTELCVTAPYDAGGHARPRVLLDVTSALRQLGIMVFKADIHTARIQGKPLQARPTPRAGPGAGAWVSRLAPLNLESMDGIASRRRCTASCSPTRRGSRSTTRC